MRKIIPLIAAVLGGLTFATAKAQHDEISGPSYVIDGDTVVVGTVHVRLKGVDAAERGTALGDAATAAMIKIVNGSDLRCALTGEKTHKRDVGYCFTADGVDINRAIIEQGFALACPRYDARYVKYEKASEQVRASYCERRR
jgi:endonuclease YncB( thermonuclease family)